jgi:hypothetical protein
LKPCDTNSQQPNRETKERQLYSRALFSISGEVGKVQRGEIVTRFDTWEVTGSGFGSSSPELAEIRQLSAIAVLLFHVEGHAGINRARINVNADGRFVEVIQPMNCLQFVGGQHSASGAGFDFAYDFQLWCGQNRPGNLCQRRFDFRDGRNPAI